MHELIDRVVPVLAFLVCITVVAEIAGLAGVFAVAGHAAARLGRGRTAVLWLLVVALSCACTAVLSLDTTAVLLTPVVVTMAGQIGLPPMPFALTGVWLANTASLLLPVSNLTNLLAAHDFATAEYIGYAWRPWLAAVTVTVLYSAVVHRRSLTGRYRLAEPPRPADRALWWIAVVVCLLLGPLLVSGVEPAIPAAGAAALLLAALAVRQRAWLRRIVLPWQLVISVCVLFVLVRLAGEHGLDRIVAAIAGSGDGTLAIVRIAFVSAGIANLVDNLPAFLMLQPAAGADPTRLIGVLIGVDAGAILLPWGSLATLLWAGRCRSLGVPIDYRRYVLLSAPLAVLAVGAAALAAAT